MKVQRHGWGKRRSKRPCGFTLVELVLVVSVVAIMAGIAVPRYSGAVARHRIELAARRIAADLQLGRAEARATGHEISIEFFPASQTYVIDGVPKARNSLEDYRVDLARSPYEVNLASVNFNGETTVRFNAYGVADAGGTIVVSNGSYTRTVTLDADTGTTGMQ